MKYLGDFAEDATVPILFTTNDVSGAAVAPSDAFEAADVAIYKDGGATPKVTTNGVTMTSPFDAVTGLHLVSIDTSDDTGDAGFWTTGSDFAVVLNPDTETVDGQTVVAVIGAFSIENRFMRGTDGGALASVATEARLAELDAANLPADLDTLLARLTAARAALLDAISEARLAELDAANLPADTDTLLARLTAARALLLDNLDATISSRALASIATEARLAELDAANLPTDVAANLTAIQAQNDLSAAEVNAEVDTALTDINLDDVVQITGSIDDPSPGASSFIGAVGLSGTDDFYNNLILVFTSGTLAGVSRRVSDYTGSTRTVTLESALPVAPANGDTFSVWGLESPTTADASAIADAVWDEALADHDASGSTGEKLNDTSTVGPGSTQHTITINDGNGDPVANAEVWISTDQGGSNVIWSGTANDAGQVQPFLDTGITFYVFASAAGVTFTNPTAFAT